MKLVWGLLYLAFIPLLSLFWLSCRLSAERCPKCGSKWQTELQGEWDGEDWACHACGHIWEVRT